MKSNWDSAAGDRNSGAAGGGAGGGAGAGAADRRAMAPQAGLPHCHAAALQPAAALAEGEPAQVHETG